MAASFVLYIKWNPYIRCLNNDYRATPQYAMSKSGERQLYCCPLLRRYENFVDIDLVSGCSLRKQVRSRSGIRYQILGTSQRSAFRKGSYRLSVFSSGFFAVHSLLPFHASRFKRRSSWNPLAFVIPAKAGIQDRTRESSVIVVLRYSFSYQWSVLSHQLSVLGSLSFIVFRLSTLGSRLWALAFPT